MFSFFRKRQPRSSEAPEIPGGRTTLPDRGAWLGVAYVNASSRDLQNITRLCGAPDITKTVRNTARLELAFFCLETAREPLPGALKERLPTLSEQDVSGIANDFYEAALRSIGEFTQEGPTQILNPYAAESPHNTRLLWDRLAQIALPDLVKVGPSDLSRVEHLIHLTATCLLLDSLSVPQEQVAAELASFNEHLVEAGRRDKPA